MKKSLIIKIVIIVLIIAGAWFSYSRFKKGRTSQSQFQTAVVEKGTIIDTVEASGNVLSANFISITSQASGLVKKVYLKDGDSVFAGQKIAELTLDTAGQQKNSQAWSAYLSAKNTLESSQATLYTLQSDMLTKWKAFMDLAQNSTYQNSDQTPNLANRQLSPFYVSQDDWLAAEAKYKNQQAVISQAKSSLNSAFLSYSLTSPTITAPFSGNINNIGLVEGMVLDGQTAVRAAVIKNEASPVFSFNVSEIDVPKLKVGQKATIVLDSLSDKTFTGKVMTVDRIGSISNNVTNYPVNIQLDTSSEEILPNMTANASIIIQTKNDVLLVPSAAIQTQAGQSFVRILKDGKEQEVNVQTGLSSDTQVEIISGLNEGDTVITGTVSQSSGQSSGSIFGGGFGGGGAFRPGGTSNQRRGQ